MRSSLRGALCGVLVCACGGRVYDDGAPVLHVTAPHDAGAGGSVGRGTTSTASEEPGLPGVVGQPGATPPPATGAPAPPVLVPGGNGGTAAVVILDAAPPPAPTTPPIVVKPPPPPPAADAGAAPIYVFGGVYLDGRIVAAFWDGAQEQVVLVDRKNGVNTYVGDLGSLHRWQSQLVYDGTTNLVYALGFDVNDVWYVYTLSIEARTLRTVRQAAAPVDAGVPGYVAGGVTSAGMLVIAYWTGAYEAVALLDPATGNAKNVGRLDGLHTWADQLRYDDAKRMVYALGEDSNNVPQVYSLALDTGKAQAANLATGNEQLNPALGGITPEQQLVVAYWNDPAQREEVGLMDPLTGNVMQAGVLNGLMRWSEQLAVRAHGSVVAYGYGNGPGAPWQFYETTIGQ